MAEESRKMVAILDVLPGPLLIKVLRALKSLTMDSRTLFAISCAGAIPTLVNLLSSPLQEHLSVRKAWYVHSNTPTHRDML